MNLKQPIFYTAGDSPALLHARNLLQSWGYDLSPIPNEHVTHLLLPVPSFSEPGIVKGGRKLNDILKDLPENLTILGGNLGTLPYHTEDFLKDEYYLAENAAITAHCALKRIMAQFPGILQHVPVLIIGWGRIGKHLAAMLRSLGADVTVAARRESDRYALKLQQYKAVDPAKWELKQYAIIVNTAPAPIMTQAEAKKDALLMDLASVRGIAGDRVDHALALPGKDAPQESGNLIAKTALRYALGKE
jgi:dipicolinate synthase subunit A